MAKCEICGREAVDKDYCKPHEKAHRNLRRKFRLWERALGLTWNQYLAEILANPHVGLYARDVAEDLSSKEK